MTDTTIRDIDFGPVWAMSGSQNFYGDGYRYHRYLKWLPGFSFEGLTFVAKTTTLLPRNGNMPLDGKLQPIEWLPKSIYVDPLRAIALNAVGLSGPGLLYLLDHGEWQKRTQPFFLSFMPISETTEGQSEECQVFAKILRGRLPGFRAPVGLQLNLTCPNTGHDLEKLAESAREKLDALEPLWDWKMPIGAKLSVEWPVEKAIALSKHPHCDFVHLSNTIPFGHLPEKINWKKLFPKGSPLLARGLKQPGGLSGAPLQPLVVEWVDKARRAGLQKPINAGGGILKSADVEALIAVGASSISVGSIAMLRPWRLRSVIARAHEIDRATR